MFDIVYFDKFVKISEKMKNSRLIPTDKVIERLRFENPWWVSREIPEYFRAMRRRLYFKLFFPFVAEVELKRAVALMGPRRVGKTVMLYHSIDQLLQDGVRPDRIFYVSIDNPLYLQLSLQEILDLCQTAVQAEHLDGAFFYFDEIQYLKDWELHLKVLVDTYPNIKFIVSGSAVAALKWYSRESGAGRFKEFVLPPLTFQEFLHLKGREHLMVRSSIAYGNKVLPYYLPVNMDELNEEFLQYLNFGGYPEVVFSEKIREDMRRYIKNDIVDKVLLRDLPSLYGIKDVQELNRFFTYLAYNTGNEFSYENMARDSGLQKETLKKYLTYLEAAFLIKVLHRVDAQAHRLKRITRFKVYLTNPSLRTALFSPLRASDEEMGNMVETVILSQWMHREKLELTYARWKEGRSEGEVDLVLVEGKPVWGVEIKWSNRYFNRPKDLKSLIHFCRENRLNQAVITTVDVQGTKRVEEELRFTYLPAAVYAFNVGENISREL
jgi:predicted AAA+ superfamily ATPase